MEFGKIDSGLIKLLDFEKFIKDNNYEVVKTTYDYVIVKRY